MSSFAPPIIKFTATKRFRALLLGAAVASVGALTALPAPAPAELSGPGVRAGANITVFHNIDMVILSGYGGAVGGNVNLSIQRGGVEIGSASGPVIDDGAGGTVLEVNHGPEGVPAPGDCFTGFTPDIQPGDQIRVTDVGGTDEVTVDNIRITQGARLQSNGDITVKGIARTGVGSVPIALAALDSAEVRNTSKFRGAPSAVVRTAGTVDGWTMIYRRPYTMDRDEVSGGSIATRAELLLAGDHAMGFGHVDPLPAESMLVDGATDVPSAALGCEGSPGQGDRVTSTDDAIISRNSGSLVVSGIKMAATTAVNVTITGAAGGTLANLPATISGNTWTLAVSRAQLNTISDGRVSISAQFDHGTMLNGPGLVRTKDSRFHKTGNARANRINGTAGIDVLSGLGGNDILNGRGGADILRGGAGSDILRGDGGADQLFGQAGADVLIGGRGNDKIDGGAGRDRINARDGVRETVRCGSGFDVATVDRSDIVRGCESVSRR